MVEPSYTLTQAADWPMLVASLKFAGWIIGGLIALCALLIAAMWRDVRVQFKQDRTDRSEQCREARATCRGNIIRELDALWEAMNMASPREREHS